MFHILTCCSCNLLMMTWLHMIQRTPGRYVRTPPSWQWPRHASGGQDYHISAVLRGWPGPGLSPPASRRGQTRTLPCGRAQCSGRWRCCGASRGSRTWGQSRAGTRLSWEIIRDYKGGNWGEMSTGDYLYCYPAGLQAPVCTPGPPHWSPRRSQTETRRQSLARSTTEWRRWRRWQMHQPLWSRIDVQQLNSRTLLTSATVIGIINQNE